MSMPQQRSVAEIRGLLAAASGASLQDLEAELARDERKGVREALRAARAREDAREAERERLVRLYKLEAELRDRGLTVVAGVDEVGRGALAGPLTAGACVLPLSPHLTGLNDSKKLSPARRREIALRIKEVAVCWSVAHVPAAEVDALGMTAALKRVMRAALDELSLTPDHVVVDGRPLGIVPAETAVVGGDGKVAAIAAASILAKVTRDELMVALSNEFPGYGFEINKGYGTLEHLSMIKTSGPTPEHRRSFLPFGGADSLF
jgi:ribonuclease HII